MPNTPARVNQVTAVSKKEKLESVQTLLEEYKPKIAAVLPSYLTPERMLRVAMMVIQDNPKLLDCTQASLIASVIQTAQLGLSLDKQLGEAYLVPYGNVCNFQPGYKGLIELAYRSNKISLVYANVVYQQDEYEYIEGLHPDIKHVRSKERQGDNDIVAFYAIIQFKDGAVKHYWMWKWEVDDVMQQSKAKGFSPWKTHYVEMGKKTVIRRALKTAPSSSDVRRAVSLDEYAEAGISQAIDLGEAEVIEEKPETDLDRITDGKVAGESSGEDTTIVSPGLSDELQAILDKQDNTEDDVNTVLRLIGYSMEQDEAALKSGITAGDYSGVIEDAKKWWEANR